MKMITFVGTSALLLALGLAAPSYAQDQHDEADKPKQQEPAKTKDAKPEPKQQTAPPKTPNDQPRPDKEKEAKAPKQQPQADQPKTEKPSKQAEKQNEEQQKDQEKAQKQQEKSQKEQQQEQHRQYAQQQGAQESRGGGGGGGRIPEDRFRAHFGREHRFRVGHPEIVEGRPHFSYGGYSFIIVQPWPADWGYDDDVYVVDDDGVYYLCDVAHPGVQLELTVVF